MARSRIVKFDDINLLEAFLNGGVVAGADLNKLPDLTGKQLKFTSPAAVTVTLPAPADGTTYRLSDIAAALTAAVAGLSVRSFCGRLVLVETTPSGGVALSADGANPLSALPLLGWGKASGVSGKVYKPTVLGGGAPYVISTYSVNETTHVAHVYE